MSDQKSKIKFKKTLRGFVVGEFKDRYGADCSIQESSAAQGSFIWLGVDKADYIEGSEDLPRMHLSQEQVSELIPILQSFVETGLLPLPDDEKED